jgi:hypothetical protein
MYNLLVVGINYDDEPELTVTAVCTATPNSAADLAVRAVRDVIDEDEDEEDEEEEEHELLYYAEVLAWLTTARPGDVLKTPSGVAIVAVTTGAAGAKFEPAQTVLTENRVTTYDKKAATIRLLGAVGKSNTAKDKRK